MSEGVEVESTVVPATEYLQWNNGRLTGCDGLVIMVKTEHPS